MEDDVERKTEPKGELDPPSRRPPTAAGAGASGPDPGQPRSSSLAVVAASSNWLEKMLNRTLDAVDELGDRVGEALHLRSQRTP